MNELLRQHKLWRPCVYSKTLSVPFRSSAVIYIKRLRTNRRLQFVFRIRQLIFSSDFRKWINQVFWSLEWDCPEQVLGPQLMPYPNFWIVQLRKYIMECSWPSNLTLIWIFGLMSWVQKIQSVMKNGDIFSKVEFPILSKKINSHVWSLISDWLSLFFMTKLKSCLTCITLHLWWPKVSIVQGLLGDIHKTKLETLILKAIQLVWTYQPYCSIKSY